MIKDIKNTKVITIVCFIVFFFNLLKADCSDLDSASCVLYSEYCEWNEELNQCQDIDGNDGGDHSYIEPSCIPFNQTDPIPMNTTAYADMCMEYLGIPPTVDCGEGIHIPIYVNGQEVFEDQPDGACDDTDFKGQCKVGSRVGRIEGIDSLGNPMPEVVWVFFCRSAGQESFDLDGTVSVQMIGYNTENGATCYFESPDAIGDNIQSEYLSYDEAGFLDGTLPSYGTSEFDQSFISPQVTGANCMTCHTGDPFIHDPWIDNAKLPSDTTQTVIPKFEYDGIDLPYFAVGGYGSQMSPATVYIEGNSCLSCHRMSLNLATNIYDGLGNVLVNEFMPPYEPGLYEQSYNDLVECWLSQPENVEGCNWIIPPGGDCDIEIIGLEIDNLLGDLNGDLVLDNQDVSILVDLVLNEMYFDSADMNFDSSLDVFDILQIVNIIFDYESYNTRFINAHKKHNIDDISLKFVEKWINSTEK